MTAHRQERPSREQTAGRCLTLLDRVWSEFVLDTDKFLRGKERRRTTVLDTAAQPPVPPAARPVLVLGTRTWVDTGGTVHLSPPMWQPAIDRRPGSIRMQRLYREVLVAEGVPLLWQLLQRVDGQRTTRAVLDDLPAEVRQDGARLLAGLVAAGVLDCAGQPFRRFLHTATRRGVLPLGRLTPRDIWRLVTDGGYRSYPSAPRIPLGREIPERLAPLYSLTRRRRSYRDFRPDAVARADVEALLYTACGVTGVSGTAEQNVRLRAYPAGGALYGVEIYPVVFAVDGLPPAVYHYRPVEHALDAVRPDIDRTPFLDAALPEEREMLAGVAVMICLSGNFPRFERKYGEGSYRMLVAEAGHISQNLILAATALGLHTRPWGGVFDDLLNRALGFTTPDEQWLLSLLVGHADGKVPEVHGPAGEE